MSTLRLLVRPTLFTAAFCGTCYCGAAVAQYENNLARHKNEDWWFARQTVTDYFQPRPQEPTNTLVRQFLDLRQRCKIWYNQLTTGDKVAYVTIFANFMVFCAWRMPLFEPVMQRYFLNEISFPKIRLSPMVLSCFSHRSLVHLGCNMFVMQSFAPVINASLGTEEMIGLFLSAGAFSSLTSIAARLVKSSHMPSLGASGALLGAVAYYCTTHPDAGLLVFFMPMSASSALLALMSLDTAGLLLGWRMIDHAAHLGGALFGVWYAKYGHHMFLDQRRYIMKEWSQVRQRLVPPKSSS